ncbi:hypothetical protein Tco_0746497 [Tanacetum coccineum]
MNMRIMPTKIELTLEQSQQCVSNDVLLSEAEDSTLSNHDTGKRMNLQSVAPLPPLKKLTGAEPRQQKVHLQSSKTNSAPAGKLKNVKMEDDPPLAIVMKELNELKLQISKNRSSYFRNKNSQQVNLPQDPDLQDQQYLFPPAYIVDIMIINLMIVYTIPYVKYVEAMIMTTYGHNRIISLRRGIKPRNPQHVTKNYETFGSNVHTTSDHNDIEWFRKREALQAKKVKSFKSSKTESSSALRSKTPTKRCLSVARRQACLLKWSNKQQSVAMFSADAEDVVIKNHTLKRDIEFHFIPTQYQLADIFIKPLDKPSFKRLIDELGMLNIDSKPEASVLTEEN